MAAALELEEAQARLLSLAPLMPVETVPVEEALGRYLAEDVVASRTQPPADLSAMDGYAIAGLRSWRVIGESRAGKPFEGHIGWGQCVRISTGAHVPNGADRILIQESAKFLQDDLIDTDDNPPRGQHIRKKGFDFAEGDVLLRKGELVGAASVALALSGGLAEVSVRRAPRVVVLDSGDELAADPSRCGPHQIPASNGAMLAAMLRPLGCEVQRIGPVADDMGALARALEKAEDADILITSGGASVGDHDLVKPALEAWGADLAFWRVAMKPGKPLMVAKRGEQVVLGLPGNPVSSFVTAFLFALPLVRKALGAAQPMPRVVTLPAGEAIGQGGVRREFIRGVWDGKVVTPVSEPDSSALAALSRSNCLIERAANAKAVEAGAPVRVYPLENGGNA